MLQIRTVINNDIKFLDLFGDEDVKMDISFAEIQDITKKNSPFTQSFKLPGSRNNNNIFNHFYDTNASVFDFDIKEKFEASLVYNGEVIYNGYLRLNSTTRIAGNIIYDVTFYAEVGDLVSNIQDKYLSDLQLWESNPNEYNVTGYPVNLQSQYSTDNDPDLKPSLYNSTNPLENGKVYFTVLNRGYNYSTDPITNNQELNAGIIPRLNFQKPPLTNTDLSYWDSERAPGIPARHVPRTYMVGHLRIKDLYESIFRENGYKVNSSFFDTAYFKRYYLPLTVSNEGLYPIQSITPDFSFETIGTTSATSVSYACNAYTWYEGPTFSVGNTAYRFNTSLVITNNDDFWFYNDSFYLRRNGTYRFRITYNVVSNDDGAYYFALRNKRYDGLSYSTCWNSGTTEDITSPFSIDSGESLQEQIFELQVNTWDTVDRWWALDFIKANNSDDIRITRLKLEVIEAPNFISGNTYNPLNELVKPDIKQLDFITSINKLFNLIVVPDPEDHKSIRVEPVIDWIGKGQVLDWTSKVNRDEAIKVQPLTTIINGTLDYDYKDDKGSSNEQFKTLNDRKFGQNIQTLNTDYRDKVLKFDNIFSSQVDTTLNVESPLRGFTIPNYFASKTEDNDGSTFVQFNPYKTTPKLLFRSVPLPIVSLRPGGTTWFSIDNTKVYNWTNNNRFITYPFGATGLTHANVWNKNDRLDITEYDLSDYEDLYDVYYSDYIEDLIDPENRLVQAQMYFTPQDVRNLKFNERIYLDGNYYRVNKIKGMSLIKEGMADVELVKLTREYRGHRVRYYDLINCTGGTDLHTSTDLNFGIYYLLGYNVSVSGDCYTVSAGTFNSGYTYQALDISTGYTDCTCETTIDGVGIDFYDELNPDITPLPSPTPVACDTTCTYYQWENENPWLAGVTYKDCYTGDLVQITIGSFNIAFGCNCDSFTPILDSGVRVNSISECPDLTPTPTPSSATQTPTPTPTLTPNACYEYQIENENPYSVSYGFTNCCTGVKDIDTLGAGQIAFVCSTTVPQGSVVVNSTSYPCSIPCPSPTPTPASSNTPTPTPPVTETPVPTPTVTRTQTVTPTPSQSLETYSYFYEAVNCNDPLDGYVVGSNTFYTIGKVLKLTNGVCAEIQGETVGPQNSTEIASYNSCDSCPR